MKNEEQIKFAEKAILYLQDYIELCKVSRKMKTVFANDEVVNSVYKITNEIQNLCKKI